MKPIRKTENQNVLNLKTSKDLQAYLELIRQFLENRNDNYNKRR